MRIRCTFGEYADPAQMPVLIAAVDEYTEEEWAKIPDFYREAIESSGATSTRECFIQVSDERVLALWANPVIPSLLSTEEVE